MNNQFEEFYKEVDKLQEDPKWDYDPSYSLRSTFQIENDDLYFTSKSFPEEYFRKRIQGLFSKHLDKLDGYSD